MPESFSIALQFS